MLWKITKALLLFLLLVLLTGYAYIMLGFPRSAPPKSIAVDRSPARVERGKYLFEVVAGCAYCHSDLDRTRFGFPIAPGGFAKGKVMPPEDGLPGTIVAVNLTSDAETGVARWSDGELIRAIREGIGHDNRPLFPGMPYPGFVQFSDEDVESIVAYIRTIPPVRNPLPKSQVSFPMNLIMRMIPKPAGSVPPVNRTGKLAYGKHLAQVSGCEYCHTPIDNKGMPLPGKFLAGGQVFSLGPNARAVSANLTPDNNTGIGTLTEAEFLEKFYQYKDYVKNGSPVIKPELNSPMPWLFLARADPGDLRAIYAYLKSVAPVVNAVVTHPDAPESKDQPKR